MNTEGQTLLQTIIANPDDDLPRLVFADWLEENGQSERAEFIRLKMSIAGITGDAREAMERRAKDLWRQHKNKWLATLPKISGLEWDNVWPRGFPERLTLDGADAFQALADEAFNAAPICRLSIGGLGTESAVGIVFSPLIKRLVEIDFLYSQIGNMGVQFLLASSHIQQIQQINLTSNGLSDHAVQALAEKNLALPALEVLVLSHNHITDAGALTLARSHGLQKLDRIYVNDNRLTADGIRALQNRFRRVFS